LGAGRGVISPNLKKKDILLLILTKIRNGKLNRFNNWEMMTEYVKLLSICTIVYSLHISIL